MTNGWLSSQVRTRIIRAYRHVERVKINGRRHIKARTTDTSLPGTLIIRGEEIALAVRAYMLPKFHENKVKAHSTLKKRKKNKRKAFGYSSYSIITVKQRSNIYEVNP